jgi:hypothetical protein
MLTGIRKIIVAGVLAGFAALFVAAPAPAMLPEGGKAASHSPRHLSALSARSTGFGSNTLYAIGCGNGSIPGTTGGDNNNYDYFRHPCGH